MSEEGVLWRVDDVIRLIAGVTNPSNQGYWSTASCEHSEKFWGSDIDAEGLRRHNMKGMRLDGPVGLWT